MNAKTPMALDEVLAVMDRYATIFRPNEGFDGHDMAQARATLAALQSAHAEEVAGLRFELQQVQGLHDERTAYVIVHRGAALACGDALRAAYVEQSQRAEQAEARLARVEADARDVYAAIPPLPVTPETADAATDALHKFCLYFGAEGLLDAALASAGDGWRPIESAPQDGTRVLLWVDGKAITGNWKHDPADAKNPSMPTHWRPLPPPPAIDAALAAAPAASEATINSDGIDSRLIGAASEGEDGAGVAFDSAEALADWPETLHEAEGPAVMCGKWRPAQVAARAIREHLATQPAARRVTEQDVERALDEFYALSDRTAEQAMRAALESFAQPAEGVK